MWTPFLAYTAKVPIGKAEVRREGEHVSLFSYGMMEHHCLGAAATGSIASDVSALIADKAFMDLDGRSCG